MANHGDGSQRVGSKEALSDDASARPPGVLWEVRAAAVFKGSAAGVVVGENMGEGLKGSKGKEKAMSVRLECGILSCQL